MTQENEPAVSSDETLESAAQIIIARFGGIRPMASKLGLAVSTVQGWKERGVIPAMRHEHIMAVARERGIELDWAQLRASDRPEAPGSSAQGGPAEEPAERVHGESAPSGLSASAGAEESGQAAPARDTSRVAREVTGEPPPAMADSSAPERAYISRGSVLGFFLGALVFALGAVGAVLTQDYWDADGSSAIVEEAMQTLQGRLSQVEERIGSVDQRLSDLDQQIDQVTQATAAGLDARMSETRQLLEGELAGIKNRLDGLDTGLAAAAELGTRVAEIERRMAALSDLEQEVGALTEARREGDQASRDVATALAVGQLRDALRTSSPFAPELAALQSVVKDDSELREALAPLEPHAAAGIPTVEQLRHDFSELTQKVAADTAGAEQGTWLDKVMGRLSNVVTVRPVEATVEEGDVGSALARARTRLEAKDLAGAVSALEQLKGSAAEAAQPWLDRARARLAADEALAALSARGTDRLSGTGD